MYKVFFLLPLLTLSSCATIFTINMLYNSIDIKEGKSVVSENKITSPLPTPSASQQKPSLNLLPSTKPSSSLISSPSPTVSTGTKVYIDLPLELETCSNYVIDTNDTNYKMAKTLDSSGDMNGAIVYLDRAIDSNICNVSAYLLRATQYRKKKDYLNAKHDLFITIKLMPTNSEGYYQLGLIYDELGQKEVSTYLFKKSCSLNNKEACNLVK